MAVQDRLDVVEVRTESREQCIDDCSRLTLVRSAAQLLVCEAGELSDERPPAGAQWRRKQCSDEPPRLEHRQDRGRDLEVSVADGPDKVGDYGLPLLTVQSLEKPTRDEQRRVVDAEADGNGVYRVGIDHAHGERGNAGRHGHSVDHVHRLLLVEVPQIGLPRMEMA